MKKLLTFLTLLTLFFATGWAETKTATLSWAGNGSNDASQALTTSNILNANGGGYYNGDANLATCTETSRVYCASSGNGLKFGTGSYSGSMTFSITGSLKPSKITVSAKRYSSSEASLSVDVNGSNKFSSTSLTSGFADYEIAMDGNTTLNTIKIYTTNKRAYVDKITITYEEGGSTTTTYNVNLNQTTGGTISASPTTAAEGATVTLTATPDPGYEFTSWEVLDGGANEVTVTNNQFAMPASDVEVEATFTALQTYGITVTGGTASPTSAYAGQTVTVTPTIPDGKVVDWDNTTISPASVTLANNGSSYTFTMPSEAVTIAFSYKDAPIESTATLTNANIVAAGNGASGYNNWTISDSNDKVWNAYAIKNQHSNATSSYHYLQIKKSDNNNAYYIQVPEYGTKILRLEMTVSGSSQPMTGGSNSATLFFSSSNTTSATGTGVVYGTGASSVTIDCSSLNLNTGYITASGAVRIWDVTVYYENGEATDVVEYYLAGDLNGWGNPVAPDYKFVEQQDGSFVLNKVLPDMENADNIRFKIAKVVNGGTPVMLGANRSGDDYGINWDNHTENFELSSASDAAAFSLSDLFNTTFKLNATATSFTVDKPQLFLVGTFNSYATPNNSSLNGALEMTSAENGGWILTNEFTDGTEFRLYDAWHEYHGGNGAWILETLLGTELNINNDNDKQSIFHIVGNGNYTITVNSDITKLIADRIQEKYSATVASGITGGSVAFNAAGTQTTLNNLTEGYEVRVYVTPSTNYELTTLTYTAEGSTTPVEITTNAGDYYTFNMPAANVTINAAFTYNGPAVTGVTYELINSTDALEAGKKYLVVYETSNYALGGTGNGAYSITIDNHQTTINSDSEVSQFVLGGSEGAWTLYNGSGYLYHTGTSASSVNQTGDGTDDASKWTISFSGDNVTLTSNSSSRLLRYYNQDFRAYQSTSNGQNIQLYKEIGVNDPKFSIPAGTFQNSDYPNGINVALTCATDGATIYYSTDGTNFSEYSSAINVTETTTIYAYATKDGKQSNTVSATYTFVDFLVADVVFSPASGTYYDDQTCQMFSTTKGARIYYTTDGSDPVMNQGTTQLYTGEVAMPATATYNFKAVAYIGTTPSGVSSASYNIRPRSEGTGYNDNLLFSVAELNAVHPTQNTQGYWQTDQSYTMVNPVQVIYMSSFQSDNEHPEFCLVRDNTGYGMIYFARQSTVHTVTNGYTIHGMGDWISGGYNGKISYAVSSEDGLLDDHPEMGTSARTSRQIYNWPTTALSNSAVLPEYLDIPTIMTSVTGSETDYWGHYVHLRKNTINLTEKDEYGKWSGMITDENGNNINYYDKFYLQYGSDFSSWTTTDNMFTGHPNRTFDVYGFVAKHIPSDPDYQLAPFAFAWIDKPVIDKETTTYYEPQTVTLSSPEDPTATIWYKTDDMDDYAVYTEPFEVNSTTTVSWYATKQSQYNDELESLIGEITMTFEEIVKPVISPESNVYAVGESVYASIAFETGKTIADGAEIVYTTDGSDPKTSETAQVYTLGTTMEFTTTTTVRAITRVGSGDRYLYSAEADAKTYTFVKSNGIEYTLITDVRNLKENGVYVIVSQNASEALSTTQNVNNRGAAGVLFVENTNKAKVYGNDDVAQFTLTVLTHEEDNAPERHFLMQTNNSDQNGYLYVGHDVQNTLMTEAEEDAMGNDVAVITIDSDGRAHIHFNYAGGDNRYLQYWNRDRLFNTYKSEYDDRAVYIYGVEATPLATIEKEGINGNDYTVADELVGVYASGNLLWCKDQGNVSINKSELNRDNGEIDFLHDVVGNPFTTAWEDCDQSNWVILDFSDVTEGKNDAEYFVNKFIAPATVTGTYNKGANYTIKLKTAPNDNEGSASFTKNIFVASNFAEVYQAGVNNRRFLNPKGTEVHTLTFAVWDGTSFTTPSTTDLPGVVSVDWTYNESGNVSETLEVGTQYEFIASVGFAAASNSPRLKAEAQTSKTFKVQPLNLTSDNVITAINTIDVNGKAVKSIKYVNVAGIVSDRPFQGVNIVVTEDTDGTRTTSKMLRK